MGAPFRNLGRAVIAATALAALTQPGPALAGQVQTVGYHLSLEINYPPNPTNPSGTPTLENVFIGVEANVTGVGEEVYLSDWASDYVGIAGPLPIAPSATTQAYNPFRIGQPFRGATPDHVMLFADYADANGDDHVVLAMDPAAAGLSAGESFDDIFAQSGMTEGTLDSWLQEVGTLSHNSQGCYYINCAGHESDLAQFAYVGLLQIGTQYPYYDGRAGLPGPFDLVSFSDGEIIGTATANLIPILGSPTTPIPEPSTWAMMLLGFAGLGYAGYRRSRSADRPIG
jgi:PEP-CTERM motif